MRLVCLAPGAQRPIKEKYGVGAFHFADSLPILVVSQESLDHLNGLLTVAVEANRFRPNWIVSGGGGPHFEDQWTQVQVGELIFRGPKPSTRCVVINVDPKTGNKGSEPLKTLANYRRSEKGILFGQYLVPESEGCLSTGDRVKELSN